MGAVETFPFRFATAYRLPALIFGVTPRTALVKVGEGMLDIRFGPWCLVTGLDNIAGVEVTGPYQLVKTAGPAHLSLTDKGITFATNGERGVCIRFTTPVPAIDPLRIIRHPGATVTVADTARLATRLAPP